MSIPIRMTFYVRRWKLDGRRLILVVAIISFLVLSYQILIRNTNQIQTYVEGYRTVKYSAFEDLADCQEVKLHMMTSSNGNIFRITGPLCGEFASHLWIPRTKASDVELWCFLWSAPWINGRVNNGEAGDLRRHCAHYYVTLMMCYKIVTRICCVLFVVVVWSFVISCSSNYEISFRVTSLPTQNWFR